MRVKWHGKLSTSRKLPGGGAMGANLGNWEFLSQTNSNADCVPVEDRFKFVDDLSTIEIINLLTVGLSSLNMKHQVPSDVPEHGQFVDTGQLQLKVPTVFRSNQSMDCKPKNDYLSKKDQGHDNQFY